MENQNPVEDSTTTSTLSSLNLRRPLVTSSLPNVIRGDWSSKSGGTRTFYVLQGTALS